MDASCAQVGHVVQIAPEHDPVLGGCLMIVAEVKSWGVQGYVRVPGQGDAWYRAPYAVLEYVGPAAWVRPEDA